MHWSHIVYTFVPVTAAFVLGVWSTSRLLALATSPPAHAASFAAIAVVLLVGLFVLEWVTLNAAGLFQLLLAPVGLALLVAALLVGAFGILRGLWSLARQQWRAGLLAGAIALVLLLAAYRLPFGVTLLDAEIKRPLRKHVITHLLASSSGSGTIALPPQSAWLSTGGDVTWVGDDRDFEVCFVTFSGILEGVGTAYSSRGDFPSRSLSRSYATRLGGGWWMGEI